jgi:hypothetical protein
MTQGMMLHRRAHRIPDCAAMALAAGAGGRLVHRSLLRIEERTYHKHQPVGNLNPFSEAMRQLLAASAGIRLLTRNSLCLVTNAGHQLRGPR